MSADSLASVTRPRRVLFLEANDDGTVGGSYQALYDVAKGLDPRRYEPVVVFYEENRFATMLRDRGIEVHVLDDVWRRERAALRGGARVAQALMLVEAFVRRVRLLRAWRIDLLHINTSPQIGYDDWLPAARLLRIPAIANSMALVDERGGSWWQRALIRSWDVIIPCSEYVAGSLRRLGVSDARIRTVHLGIDIEEFRRCITRTPAEVRAAEGIPADAVILLMVGNLRRWKGQHVVLEAVGMLPEALRRHVRLLLVGAAGPGDADYERELHEIVARTGTADVVRFLGTRIDVPSLVAAADVCLHASTSPEPFGLVVVEGLALGKVMIAAALGGPLEIIDDGSGLLFDPAKPAELTAALARVIPDAELRHRFGEAAMRRAERFTVGRIVDNVQDVYARLLA